MSIWHTRPTVEQLNYLIYPKNYVLLEQIVTENQLVFNLGIEFTEVGDDYLEGRMPVDERSIQGKGVVHGAAYGVLADTIGGVAANCTLDQLISHCVTIEMKTNITKAVRKGFVRAFSKPLHMGKTTQVWSVHMTDEMNDLCAFTTLTMHILKRER